MPWQVHVHVPRREQLFHVPAPPLVHDYTIGPLDSLNREGDKWSKLELGRKAALSIDRNTLNNGSCKTTRLDGRES